MSSLPINTSSENRPESAPTNLSTAFRPPGNGSPAIGVNLVVPPQNSCLKSPPKTIKNVTNTVTPEGSDVAPPNDDVVGVAAKRNLGSSLSAVSDVLPAPVHPKKKSKPSKQDIKELDLKSAEGIKFAFVSLKGDHEPLPSDLSIILRDVLDSYTVPILKVLHVSLFGEEWKSGLKADLIIKLSSKIISNSNTAPARDAIPRSSSTSLPIDPSISLVKEVPGVLKIR